jgi:hypothetical protein
VIKKGTFYNDYYYIGLNTSIGHDAALLPITAPRILVLRRVDRGARRWSVLTKP